MGELLYDLGSEFAAAVRAVDTVDLHAGDLCYQNMNTFSSTKDPKHVIHNECLLSKK